jgi:amidase
MATSPNRRDFLRTAGLAAAWAAFDRITPRSLPGTPWLDPGPSAVPSFELEEATLAQLQEWMRSGRYTSQQLCQLYLARIEALDHKGPTLKSVIETNPDALGLAAQLDAERKAGKVRGPLHGIPVLIKDNIATADRMETTAGSLALVGARPPRDAFIVERLREAGAVILGKTNLSEWANFRSSHSTSGWSGRGGLCRSPYALDRNPCGSSSGSGAAAAANLCAVAIGTETDGSIVCPSGANALVGIKPTVGLVSRAGIIPIAHSQDTAGPMCRTVTDAAILLGAIQGADPRDPATAAVQRGAPVNYTTYLDPRGLNGARIGVARARFFGFHPAVDSAVNEGLAVLKAQGAEIVDPADLPHAGEYDDAEFTVLLYEFKDDINRYLAGLGPNSPMKTLADLIAFNQQHRKEEMPYFGQEIFVQSQAKGPLTDDAYVEAAARCRRLARTEGLDALFADKKLDAIVAPTNGPAWTTDLVDGDHFTGGSSTPAAVSGCPSITVPAGFVYGLPVGMSFIGKAWSEATLVKLAFAYEQASKARKPPQFLPSADLTVG